MYKWGRSVQKNASTMALRKAALLRNLPPLPPQTSSQQRSTGGPGRKEKYSPLSWDSYFDSSRDYTLSSSNDIFRVYFRGSCGPVVFCLHGGGHSSLSWALMAVSLTELVTCRVVAMDIRGHGSTHAGCEDDLQASTLINDVLNVVAAVFLDEPTPPLVLVGHSMGGAIAVRVAARNVLPSLCGLVVLDVVEGSAMDSLTSMQSFLRGRPQRFTSLEKAIEWSVRSGQVRNVESARVAMAGQLTQSSSQTSSQTDTVLVSPPVQPLAVLNEEEEEVDQGSPSGAVESVEKTVVQTDTTEYVWRIDLSKTEPYWQGWFSGLSKLFLNSPVPKVLLLAGVDRLDKELAIGQMQGKFQLQVLSGCGHLIQEDVPDKVAEILALFLKRYKLVDEVTMPEKGTL